MRALLLAAALVASPAGIAQETVDTSLPQSFTSAEAARISPSQTPVGTFFAITLPDAQVFDTLPAFPSNRIIGLAFFRNGTPAPYAIPYVFCPAHRIYEKLDDIRGVSVAQKQAVGIQIAVAYRARWQEVGTAAPPAQPVPSPSLRETPAIADRIDRITTIVLLGGLGGIVLLILGLGIALGSRGKTDSTRPFVVTSPDVELALSANDARLRLELERLRTMHGEVAHEEQRLIKRVADITKRGLK